MNLVHIWLMHLHAVRRCQAHSKPKGGDIIFEGRDMFTVQKPEEKRKQLNNSAVQHKGESDNEVELLLNIPLV